MLRCKEGLAFQNSGGTIKKVNVVGWFYPKTLLKGIGRIKRKNKLCLV